MMQVLILLLSGGAVLLPLFTLTWAIQLKTRNAAIVDVVWSACFPVLAMLYYLTTDVTGPKQILLLIMVGVWGLRLAFYLLQRTLGHGEDVRYTALREQWGTNQNLYMLRFFYYQAILAVILSLPFALIMANPETEITWVEWVGAILWVIAVAGESIADAQLRRFKSVPLNKGKICQSGLWNYSRHPNYFFEWLIWVSFFIAALGSPWGWISIICPAMMLYFLLKITGIPYTETQMVKSRGQAYIDYQKSTSSFVPLPPRHVV